MWPPAVETLMELGRPVAAPPSLTSVTVLRSTIPRGLEAELMSLRGAAGGAVFWAGWLHTAPRALKAAATVLVCLAGAIQGAILVGVPTSQGTQRQACPTLTAPC